MIDINNTKISVIIPVFNVEQYIDKCVKSILDQTFSDFEIILIDDGSDDLSGKICDEYTFADKRIKAFHKRNEGVSSARNLGLENANGEWITFVDPDDWIEKDCFKTILAQAEKNHLDCIQYSYKRINSQGTVFETNTNQTAVLNLDEYIKTNAFTICAWGSLFKKKIAIDNNIRFIKGLKLAEDQIFMLTIIASCKRMQRIPDMFYCYYLNENSATQKSRFVDICTSITALDTFSYRMKFQSYIDTMILKLVFVSLKQEDCKIATLYRTLRKTKVNPQKIRTDYKRYWLLKKMWKHYLFIALLLIRLHDVIKSKYSSIN